ncbi:MAG: hypothetical protein JST80_13545 [Bdellovibrionales bacterium]|nr:hypothetical protein [Bdellovibrionales bacterium]
MDLKKKLYNLNQRRYDTVTKSVVLSEAVRNASGNDAVQYLMGAMEEVSKQQTEIVTRTGERVRSQLEDFLNAKGFFPSFDYQGSVTNNTHIKIHSDIDLLVVTGRYFTPKNGSYAHLPDFTGSPQVVIHDLRSTSKLALETRFPAATVKEKALCLGISGGSLQRDVDVVICNWVKNQDYEKDENKFHLGIRIRDVESGQWIENYPFMHNAMLNYRDSQAHGNHKRAIRLLKSLKEDADQNIIASSYDICGLVYNCSVERMESFSNEPQFQFLQRFVEYLRALETNSYLRDSLKVPNQTRPLFGSDGLSVSEMRKLTDELSELLVELRNSQQRPGLTGRSPWARMLSERIGS